MRTLSAKKLSLEKARDLGIYEEPLTLGDCELVLRNLRPDEYEQVLTECAELDQLEYVNVFQKAHVSRSICSINGIDLRDVDFIEDEEPEPKTGRMRNVKVELHAYLRKNVVDTWAKEVLFVAYRKFGDVVAEAERKSRDGIVFRTADETPEEKYRRLLGDMKEAEAEVPQELVERILDDAGYMVKRQINVEKLVEAASVGDPLPDPEDTQPTATAMPVPEPQETVRTDPAALMRQRVPMNRAPGAATARTTRAPVQHVAAPPPSPPPYREEDFAGQVDENGRRVQPPGSVPQVASIIPQGTPTGRSAQIAAEMDAEERSLHSHASALMSGSSQAGSPQSTVGPQGMPGGVPVLSGGAKLPDPTIVKKTIDQSTVGLNPRYRSHNR